MYVLVHCVDRNIGKTGTYATYEEAHHAMMTRIYALTGSMPRLDSSGSGWIVDGGSGEVNGDNAYLNNPTYGGCYDYDWKILEV